MAENNINKNAMEGNPKSNFSVTCSLLSKYLKENGRLIELLRPPINPQGKSRTPTTMCLLPGLDISKENIEEKNFEENSPKSTNLFPYQYGFESNIFSSPNEPIVKEMKKAQMTIFYAGKIVVYDDFPLERANDLIEFASKENSNEAQNLGLKASLKSSNDNDMPIARRNSLHRFLEKRKDRIGAKAPYQVQGSSSNNQGWLGLE